MAHQATTSLCSPQASALAAQQSIILSVALFIQKTTESVPRSECSIKSMYQTAVLTSAGFRLITTNCSARCIKKFVNLWQRIVSISSACFTAILTRTLLTLVSMRHFSCSLRQIVTGFRRSSLLDLQVGAHRARREQTACQVWKTEHRGEGWNTKNMSLV